MGKRTRTAPGIRRLTCLAFPNGSAVNVTVAQFLTHPGPDLILFIPDPFLWVNRHTVHNILFLNLKERFKEDRH
ncbi:hypothetical protein CEXT_735741 [Caerostris extrusa]|uniref:Uncharacterized protein n=1 Tax=Caerostris extrusa TaxID=172846 RepID=A0AAV4NVG8_CAEEX|nr:hypothetical protein CEXT_735741 [Caerostris extrusa]